MVPISSFLHYPPLCLIEPLLSHAAHTWSLPTAHRQLSVDGTSGGAVPKHLESVELAKINTARKVVQKQIHYLIPKWVAAA
jgi:hypothetical protein